MRYALRRLLQLVPIVLVVVATNYALLRLAPGDLVDVMAGEAGSATPEYMDELRKQFGLDQPDHVRFLNYLGNLAQLDLGFSFRHSMPVATLIGQRLPATLLLMLSSLTLAITLGVTLGVVAARSKRRWLDEAIAVLSTIGFATPLFWIGLLLIVLFSVNLGWLPTGGMITVGRRYDGFWDYAADIGVHLVLPSATLGFYFVAIYARLTRSAMLEVAGLDFVRTARAKGIGESRITVRHILRNALLPIVTLSGVQLGALLGGSIVVETVFAWPGLGRLAFEAVFQRDINLLLGIFLCSSLLVILMNLLVDLLYAVLDPRIEVG